MSCTPPWTLAASPSPWASSTRRWASGRRPATALSCGSPTRSGASAATPSGRPSWSCSRAPSAAACTRLTSSPTPSARLAINALVQQQTGGKIKDLFAPGSLDDYTRLVLTNAIYLKARWRQPFDPHDTRPAPFHTLDGGTPQVPTMHHQAVTLPYAQGDGWQAVELAYKGGALAMDVLLPAAGEFASFQQGLAPDWLAAVLGALRPTTLDLALPKVTFDSTHQLNQTLETLGMPTAFTDAADFRGIFTISEPLKVQTVVQKAHVPDTLIRRTSGPRGCALPRLQRASDAPINPVVWHATT